ncbi:2-phospho-L-lactate transferase [Nostoc sp. 3335mG]|nr:2-phospho-L-lactate transferase [Nostoc sp. 3335mG]
MGKIVVLTGGIGGAKLVLGLTRIVPPDQLTAIVNTGDDFRHLGLHISPDIDTLLYTLSGLADPERGWGRAGETWNFMAALRAIGGEDWFMLGDADLALHVERTRALKEATLGAVTRTFARALGIDIAIAPMSDDPVATRVVTDEGELDFQRYFVQRRCEPVLSAVRFEGAERASPSPEALTALDDPELSAILIAPSNPWLSIDPILAVPGMRQALRATGAPIVVVTPLPGGKAVKGPTAKIMAELRLDLTAASIARHYAGLADGILLDEADDPTTVAVPSAQTDTLMRSLDDRVRVARAAIDLAATIGRRAPNGG